MNAYIDSVLFIYYLLVAVHCLSLRLSKQRILFRFHWSSALFVVSNCWIEVCVCRGCWCTDKRWDCNIFSASLTMGKYGRCLPDRWHFLQLVSLNRRKLRSRQDVWYLKISSSAHNPLSVEQCGQWKFHSGLLFWKGFVTDECNDVLEETLGVNENQLAGLFRRAFGTGPKDKFQKSLAWQCYRRHCWFG